MNCPVCGSALAPGTKFCPECGTRLAIPSASREVRKTVTVLFADVAGSTALGERLDPESMRALMGRYFAEIRKVIEGHGGTVEKFIGDAVMAVFGIPILHEDDALRAVRAAAEIGERLVALNTELRATGGPAITFRTGIFTGEVVAGDPGAGQTLVTGDTVNTAARLEQAATPGDILLGLPTYRLVRDAVTVEELEPIRAKGKEEPVPAFRLLSVAPGSAGHARRTDTPLVGRVRELHQLHEGFARAVADRSPQLVTILGTAGIGKSRLVADFLESIGDLALVLRGRCLPYGEGITYWPLREIVHAAAAITEGQSASGAKDRLRSLLDGDPDADLLARRVGAAIGLETEGAPQDEIFWATRRLFEHLARKRPLVTLWEDIHWAEPTLLDLLEYIVDLGADAPLLLLCPARPELVETRAGWGANRANALTLHLEPLGADVAEQLVDRLPGGIALPGLLRSRILIAAEGNPLYLEEMLAMLVDEGRLVERGGAWQATEDLARVTVPPSVRALLSARIDALPKDERQVAERASVAGRVFEAAAVRELSPDAASEVGRSLLALVRKELVKPERSELSAGDAFKFRHLLIRDAAYEALPKRERADLHERFAAWLEHAAGDRLDEYEDVVGYHLERAHECLLELGAEGERVERLAHQAGAWLARAGEHALSREDAAAADGMLRRARRLLPVGAKRAEAAYLQGIAALATGDAAGAEQAFESIVAAPEGLGAAVLARAQVGLIEARMSRSAGLSVETAMATIDRAIETLETDDDALGLALAWNFRAFLLFQRVELSAATDAWQRAAAYADRSGYEWLFGQALSLLIATGFYGAVTVDDAVRHCEEMLKRGAAFGIVRARAHSMLAVLNAYRDHFAESRQHAALAWAIVEETGLRGTHLAECAASIGDAQLAMGDLAAAERAARLGYDMIVRTSDRMFLAGPAAMMADAIERQGGRDDEALRLLDEVERHASLENPGAVARANAVRSRILANRGERERSIALARESLMAVQGSDEDEASMLDSLGEVQRRIGHLADAEATWSEALRRFQAKGCTTQASDVLSRLDALKSAR